MNDSVNSAIAMLFGAIFALAAFVGLAFEADPQVWKIGAFGAIFFMLVCIADKLEAILKQLTKK